MSGRRTAFVFNLQLRDDSWLIASLGVPDLSDELDPLVVQQYRDVTREFPIVTGNANFDRMRELGVSNSPQMEYVSRLEERIDAETLSDSDAAVEVAEFTVTASGDTVAKVRVGSTFTSGDTVGELGW